MGCKGDKKVLSYGDVVLWSSDVQLLRGHFFLNDRLIEFFFAQLAVPHHLLLLSPAISFWISHCPDTLTLSPMVEPLRLLERQVVMFAVNDNEDVGMVSGGSHWSLLVYIRELNKFEHYDSMGGSNAKHAKQLASVMRHFLGPDAQTAEYEEPWAPQQENGYDCGLYVMALAEVFCQAYASGGSVCSAECRALMREKVTPFAVSEMRGRVLSLISSLAEDQQKTC